MVVYIATVNGRVLTDPFIHKLLNTLAKNEKVRKIDWVYRCGPRVNDPSELIDELEGLKDSYKVICYESSDNWNEMTDEDIKALKKINETYKGEPSYRKPNSGQILSAIIAERMNNGSR